MKKLINSVDDVVNESLAGFCAAHSDIVRMGEAAAFVLREIFDAPRCRRRPQVPGAERLL